MNKPIDTMGATDKHEQATITFEDGRSARVLVEILRVEPSSNISGGSDAPCAATSIELYGLAISADAAFQSRVAERAEYSALFNAPDDPQLAAEMGVTDTRLVELVGRRRARALTRESRAADAAQEDREARARPRAIVPNSDDDFLKENDDRQKW